MPTWQKTAKSAHVEAKDAPRSGIDNPGGFHGISNLADTVRKNPLGAIHPRSYRCIMIVT